MAQRIGQTSDFNEYQFSPCAKPTKERECCLYFSDDSTFEGLCLFGNVVAHFEREYRELLWNKGDEKYYPNGVEDEDYCILEFIAESGRFYRYDKKGDLSASEIEIYDKGKEFKNGYHATNANT